VYIRVLIISLISISDFNIKGFLYLINYNLINSRKLIIIQGKLIFNNNSR